MLQATFGFTIGNKKKRGREILHACSLFKCLEWLQEVWAEAKSQGPNPGLPHELQGADYLHCNHSFILCVVLTGSQKPELDKEPRLSNLRGVGDAIDAFTTKPGFYLCILFYIPKE